MSNHSKYCYSGTDILINLPNIKDQKMLTKFENLVVTLRNTQLGDHPIKGSFDLKHLQNIHHFLFQDVYPFAGKIRTENITKDGFPFARIEYIISQVIRCLALHNKFLLDWSRRNKEDVLKVNTIEK